MDLFGAATMGVDPKTGSYLSKEQRVAMFRSSRGQGGSGGGGAKVPGGGTRATVDPKSSIVVAKKNMLAVVETLQKNQEETTNNVAEQVARNTENINKIGQTILSARKEELKSEQKEYGVARKRRGDFLRKKREELIEGAATLAAKVAEGAQKIGDSAFKKTKGFLDKLKDALILLGGAWLIDNLPAIESAFKDLLKKWEEFPKTLDEMLKYTKGAWGFLDKAFQSVRKTFGKITDKVVDSTKWVRDKGKELVKKVFRTVKNFFSKLISRGVDLLKGVFQRGSNEAEDAVKKPTPTRGAAARSNRSLPSGGGSPKALPPASGGRTPTPRGNSLGNMWESFKSFAGKSRENILGGLNKVKTSVGENLSNLAGNIKSNSSQQIKWLTDSLEPLLSVPGLGGLSKTLKNLGPVFGGMLRIFPPLSLAIDLAINKGLEGRSWTESIIGALGSTLLGGVSAAVGGKVGAGVGGVIGQAAIPIPGVGFGIGAAIGGALGAAIAGMVGGQIGDELALRAGENISGNEREAAPTLGTNMVNAITGVFNMTGADAVESLNSAAGSTGGAAANKSMAFSGLSTPAGMDLTEAAFGSDVQFIDMPPEIIDMTKEQNINPETAPREAETLPSFSTRDVDMEAYRITSMDEYQLAF